MSAARSSHPRRSAIRAARAAMAVLPLFAAVVPAHAESWTQVYVGGAVGADVVSGKAGALDQTGPDDVTITGEGVAGGDLGVTLRAGADYQLSNHFVVGLVGIYDWSDIETTGSLTAGNEHAEAELLKLDHAWTVAARLGLLLTPDLMAYGLVGYTHVDFDDIRVSTPEETVAMKLESFDRLALGGGLEHRLTNALSLIAEYRTSDLGHRNVLTLTDDEGNTSRFWAESRLHWARVGANYRFGGTAGDATASEAPKQRWTGFYAGGGASLDAVTRDLSVREQSGNGCDTWWDPNAIDFYDPCAEASLTGLGGGGAVATVTAGYDVRMGTTVAGLFANYDWSDQEVTLRASSDGDEASVSLLSTDRSWTIGARLGYLAAEDVLVYGLAGYTSLSFKDLTASFNDEGGRYALPDFTGFTVGAGFEKMLTQQLALRLEYRYVNLDGQRVLEEEFEDRADAMIDPSLHSARATLVYRLPTGAE